MIDFDIRIGPGAMLPSEALQACRALGLRAVALLYRSDGTDLEGLKGRAAAIRAASLFYDVRVLTGVALAGLPPALISGAVSQAREFGAEIIGVEGESITANAEQGTNFAAVAAGADILLSPGLIDDPCLELAAEKGTLIELCGSPKHAFTNAHVAAAASRAGAALCFGSGADRADKLIGPAQQRLIMRGAAMSDEQIRSVQDLSGLFRRFGGAAGF